MHLCIRLIGLITSIISAEKHCFWPKADILFALDSTPNIDSTANHRRIVDFVRSQAHHMHFGEDGVQIAVAQFTPQPKYEFGFVGDSFDSFDRRLSSVGFVPCQSSGTQCSQDMASLNTLVRGTMSADQGNRAAVPDIVVVISTSLYQPREFHMGEVLVRPLSPTHIFLITIGNGAPTARYMHTVQFAATTAHLASVDFLSLAELEIHLCESVNSFLGSFFFLRWGEVTVVMISENEGESSGTTGNVSKTGLSFSYSRVPKMDSAVDLTWWRYLQWNVSSCSKTNDLNTVYWNFACEEAFRRGHGFLKPSICILIICLTAVIALLFVLCFCYGLWRYRIENRRLNSLLRLEKENFQKREQYFTERLRERSAHEKERERTMMDLINESGRIRDHYGTSRREHSLPLPVTVVPPEEEEITINDETLNTFERSHLPADHPARSLPPVDLLLLVDASSSIGINGYETVKQVLRAFVSDVDVGPGRSRVAAILFAAEPQVYFGFNRFYSHRSIRSALRRMPYLGGPTFLAKALSFAAGVLYQEQNMKEVHHKNRTMPTPRHDRPQIMVVVSDGVSDDNFDQQATHLHERMLIKIAALVTKSFNKERMIPITRFDGAIFTLDQKEALSIWLWRTQRLWNEHYADYVEREKSFSTTARRL